MRCALFVCLFVGESARRARAMSATRTVGGGRGDVCARGSPHRALVAESEAATRLVAAEFPGLVVDPTTARLVRAELENQYGTFRVLEEMGVPRAPALATRALMCHIEVSTLRGMIEWCASRVARSCDICISPCTRPPDMHSPNGAPMRHMRTRMRASARYMQSLYGAPMRRMRTRMRPRAGTTGWSRRSHGRSSRVSRAGACGGLRRSRQRPALPSPWWRASWTTSVVCSSSTPPRRSRWGLCPARARRSRCHPSCAGSTRS